MNLAVIYAAHNATVSLFRDDRCTAVLHEEKYSNIKNHMGFPFEALKALDAMLPLRQLDAILFPASELLYLSVPKESSRTTFAEGMVVEDVSRMSIRKLYDALEYHLPLEPLFFSIRDFAYHRLVTPKAKAETLAYLQSRYSIEPRRVHFLNHHTCHCYSPVAFYGLHEMKEDVLLFSMDGAGDNEFARVMRYSPQTGVATLIASSPYNASLGLLYSEVTRFLGMKPLEHEYKVMGLAAYNTDTKYNQHAYELFRDIVHVDTEKLTFHSRFNTNLSRFFLRKHLVGERFDNIAGAVQRVLEELVLKWVRAAMEKTGLTTIACSGGVFMNVKLNMRIQEEPRVRKVFFMPSAGDESNVIGAAAYFMSMQGTAAKKTDTMYLGQSYTSEQVAQFLADKKASEHYAVTKCSDIEEAVADLLAKFQIVARVQGASEWGARSLCNRGIIGNASDLKTFYEVNDAIKIRDFWMPFAPTIHESWAARYIENWAALEPRVKESSRYMITAFHATPLAQEHLRAAIHQKDKTLRPQIVADEENPTLARLLRLYEKKTGLGGFMNTSLNMHGYPLAATLEQVWFTFEKSGLKHLALEDFLISKRG